MGILLVLGLLWTLTEVLYRMKKHRDSTTKQRVATILRKIDMTTIIFFLGILLAVATLKETGVLPAFGQWLNEVSRAVTTIWVTGVIGVASSIVDNVPLVAGCMNMYPIELPATSHKMVCSGSCWLTAPVWVVRCSSSVVPPGSWPWAWRRSPSAGI